MSVKSCEIFKSPQVEENQCVNFCSSSTSLESCADNYTNEIALPSKEELFRSGDVNIEQSNNVHVGQKTLYENCYFRVVNYSQELSEVSNSPKDSSESENKTSHFQKSNTSKFKLWIRKDIGQITIVIGVFLLLIIASVLMAIFLNTILESTTESETIESTSSIPTTTDAPQKEQCPSPYIDGRASGHAAKQILGPYWKNFAITSRENWNASVYEYEPIKLEIPEYVIISHTLQRPCDSFAVCVDRVQTLQKYDRTERNLDDIRYNFLIGAGGLIFEGRGWNVAGQHTDNFNNRSLGIAFIIDSNKYQTFSQQRDALIWLLKEGVRNKKLIADYKMIGRCQVVYSTDSPGHYVWARFVYGDHHWISDPLKFVKK